ncbi:MAG TPA: tyrosine--tRNA ligase, partial [Gemmatimonadaceae bacterium]|nr:tyrosine--tRNA ligase [Gemmatimonadaceae bacterium]
ALMRDNAKWLRKLELIPFLRDIGKHFRVNQMLGKESVKARLESEVGISFTEFAYMLTQAYDFLVLYQQDGATLQVGGSDQWGNITAGIDLIHRVEGGQAHGLTVPLVTTASGSKFGKSEAGAVWLDPALTSPYKFYQFWVNADDRDVGKYLRYFTLLEREEIEALDRATAERPGDREAQRALARDVTAHVHGDEAARVAAQVSELLFGGGDPATLSDAVWYALRQEVPYAEVETDARPNGQTSGGAPPPDGALDVAELLVAVKLVKSKGEARRLLEQGGLSANGRRLGAGDRFIARDQVLGAGFVLLRKGARDYGLVRLAAP